MSNKTIDRDDPPAGINAGLEGFYEAAPIRRNYSVPPDPHQLTKDLNVAHSNIRKLVREKDGLHRHVHFLRVWNKVVTAAVLGSWAVILLLLKICILDR